MDRFEDRLNYQVVKVLCEIDGCLAVKRHARSGDRGKPDVTGCINGQRLELEGKTPGSQPTPKQRQWLRRWKKVGAITGVYHSVWEALSLIKAHGHTISDEIWRKHAPN
jgi:hypothetical protein